MIITNIRFAKLVVPLVTPFKTSMRQVDNIEDLVVMIETDTGDIGYGSAPATPLITGDTHETMVAVIEHLFRPKLLGRDLGDLNVLLELIQNGVLHHSSAKASVEIALYDLWGKLYQAPLYKLLGGGKSKLKTDITISVDSIDKMLSDSTKAIAQGFDVLKVKVGDSIHQDIERVKAIHSAVKNKAIIRLDVNQGWTAKQTVFAEKKLMDAGVELELIEQPVKADDLIGMRYVTEKVSTPVMADESAFSPKQVIDLLHYKGADIINIKLMKTGGLSNAIKIADICQLYDVQCMIGCMLEGSIAVAAAAHLACAKENIITKIDLDGPTLGKYDPVLGGVDFSLSNITLSDGYGLGIEKIDGLLDL
jgi:o-succinylbenzoate synthase